SSFENSAVITSSMIVVLTLQFPSSLKRSEGASRRALGCLEGIAGLDSHNRPAITSQRTQLTCGRPAAERLRFVTVKAPARVTLSGDPDRSRHGRTTSGVSGRGVSFLASRTPNRSPEHIAAEGIAHQRRTSS